MNASLLLWGVLFSSVGLGYFTYGKKQQRRVALVCGLGLMIVPYVIASVSVLIGLCLALMALPYFYRM